MNRFFTLIIAIAVDASAMANGTLPNSSSPNPTKLVLNAQKHDTHKYGNFTFITPLTRAKQAANDRVKVTLNYECSSSFVPIGLSIYNPEAGMFHSNYESPNKSITQSVPKGTYDMFASYMSHWSELYYVFREQVEIKGDTTITLSQAEATIPFSIKTVDHTGKALHMPVYNTSYQIVEPGTADDFSSLSFFILEGFGNVASIIGGGYKYQGHETDFYINKLSNRYKICESRVVSVGDVFWFNKYVINDLSTGKTITNDPSRFIKYDQKFAISPKWKDNSDFHVPGYYMAGVIDGEAVIGQRSYIPFMPSTDYTTKFYLDTPKDGDGISNPFNVLVKPLMSEYMVKESYSPGDTIKNFYFTCGQQVMGDKNGLYYVTAGYEEDGGFNSPQGMVRSQVYPGHPALSFTDKTAANIVYGESCPVNSVRFTSENVDGQEQISIIPNYVGRYGELRDADYHVVEQQEQQVTDNIYSIILTNKNVNVDGLDGMNKTQLVMIENKTDHVPPTLQMLQFKDKQGNVTDRFKEARDGVVEIAGGDFTYNPVPESYTGYFTCTPAEIQVSCYQHGATGPGMLLTVEEVPTLYFMPGFGHFFRASLEPVSDTSQKQWYDMEITLTDPSGNKQTQTISPAFCIMGTESGITSTTVSTAGVTIENGKITSQNRHAMLQLYSIDGRLAAQSRNGEILTDGMAHGVYVVKIIDTAGNCQSQKVML